MRLSLRFIIPLILALALIAYAVVPLVDQLTVRWFVRDLDIRSELVANTVQEQLQELVRNGTEAKMLRFFNKLTQDERLYAVGFCDGAQEQLVSTQTYPQNLACKELNEIMAGGTHLLPSAKGPLHVSVHKIEVEGETLGRLVLVHDMSFVQRRTEETKRYALFFFIGLGTIVSLITVIIAQLSWRGWVQGMRALMRGEGLLRPAVKVNLPELQPLARDLRMLIRDLEAEHRPRDESQITWSPETLKRILREELRGEDIIVVSNREPYIHVRKEDVMEVQRPASGLVTALEPVMRACSGVWIAHGSGSADRQMVDRNGHVAVPPENPSYQLRRIWLTKEEEVGYYYGFANEGLWPLCHIAHVRPTFRTNDWNNYAAVNRKFALAVKEESRTDAPIVLVQDYHFALLARMIRELLPRATIITFWHIPWPNPEAFAICPWRAELIDGLLGSSILGFHTQFHCNNFVDTVDRQLEARVDRELFTVSYRSQLTAVKRYPISIQWPPSEEVTIKSVDDCRAAIRQRHGLPADHAIGIGVDRLDYTKGILERFNAVERLLEIEPRWVGRFSFIQIAAPSRSSIEQYQQFEVHVRAMASRINERFAAGDFPTIILKVEHHEPHEVYEYYRAADLCFVSSLHDGMNLVAKEFVSSREDEHGVLILSQFTGASRELPESLVVNPYDIDQCAAALHIALTMAPVEQRGRMRIMRGLISEFNVYRWAGRMLLDAADMRMRGRLAFEGTKQASQANRVAAS
jgi:trehalose 6-phosphate synthase